ncbi:LPXTG cell wall anchor domain-containing protein [Arthrobacter psychrolactophilus]
MRLSAGVLGLAMLASIGAGAVVSAPAQANTPDATVSATPAVVDSSAAVDTHAEEIPSSTLETAEDAKPAVVAAPAEVPANIPAVEDAEKAPETDAAVDPGTQTPAAPKLKQALAVQALVAATVPPLTCASGVVYTISNDGKIRQVNTGTGGEISIGTIVKDVEAINGLALTKDATSAYAVRSTAAEPENVGTKNRPNWIPSYMTVYRYDSVSGETTPYKVQENISTPGTFVMGGINPKTGIYYYGRVVSSKLELYAFDTLTNTEIGLVGSVPVASDSGSWVRTGRDTTEWRTTPRSNGDLVFSSDGTMYFVASSNTNAADSNVLMEVNEELPTTAAGASLTANEITKLNINNEPRQFNGIAFEGGYLFLDTSEGYLYKVNASNGSLDGVPRTGLTSPVDMASCQYNNTLQVQKNIVDRVRAEDQFSMTASVDNEQIGAAGTTVGIETGLQTGPGTIASSVPVSGSNITIKEVGVSGTNLTQYASSWICENGAGTRIASGSGTSGTFIFPPQTGAGVNITCVFTNQPLSAQVTVTKTWVNAVAGDTASFTANAKTGTSKAPTNGTVITASFAQGTMVNVAEVLGAANKGAYATTLKCTNAAGTTVAEGNLTGSFTLGASNVKCVYTNTNTPASIVVAKKWIVDGVAYDNGKQPAGISADLTLTGPGTAGATAQAWGTERAGYFVGNNVSIAESMKVDPQMRCTLTKSALTRNNGTTVSSTLPSNVVLAAGLNSYTVTNTVDCTTELTLLKFIDGRNGGNLTPGDFTLTAAPAGGATWEVTGATSVTTSNTKKVVAGTAVALSESSTLKPAYLQLRLQRYTGPLNPDLSLTSPDYWADVDSATVSVATGHHEIYRFVNASVPTFTLPLTGGTGSSPYLLVGGGLLVLAILAAAWVIARRVRSQSIMTRRGIATL